MGNPLRKLFVVDADLRGHDFSNAILEGVCCMGACFDGASFRGADLYWAIAMGASFRDCDLSEADLRGADLKDAIFAGARLIRTDLSRDNLGGSTQLQGADLSAAAVQNCRFEGAEYDLTTKFPKGFYPEKHGLVLSVRSA
jgi:uncharacterized protein YjbI with pentapeptide repeats